ncbi:hypothetical protein [Streptomyces chryseus]|uniref:hypothetical protein n=1 Tax=Streptomyces chryseus TaxID=68186 RepID=UPI00110FE755|nr:hypothetical protein [Streptomyces chryseus]GGX40043.1 hypothetical protein GCM10010353_64380 [Streptomyces chryseus]
MSRYRIQYAPPPDQARSAMEPALRARFDTAMQRLAVDPYRQGSAPVKTDEDRRAAVVAGVVIRYYVSAPALTVTIVRVVYI